MGYALGLLMKEQINQFVPQLFEYAVNLTETWLIQQLHMKPELAKLLAETVGLKAWMDGLKMTYDATIPYTPQHFTDEIQGLSDASGFSQNLITLVNQIPELIKATCSMFGGWGPAIPQGNTVLQLRALDWQTDGPFNDFPLLTVFHPDHVQVPGSTPFATFGYPGFVGAITGFSSTPIGISEIGTNPLNGTDAIKGYPFPYVLRDILEFDDDVEMAYSRMYNANRTCAIWVGVADLQMNQFRMFAYGHDYLVTYDDTNCPSNNYNPRFTGVIYNFQHSNNYCVSTLIQQNYGNIDYLKLLNMTAADKTGTTQVAIYDYTNNYMYLSHASSAKTPPIVIASLRPLYRVDMNQMWAETAP